LKKQISSLIARVEVLGGKKLSFDEEAKAYYDVEPPVFAEEHFKKLVAELETIVPGKGPIPERIENFREQFTITPDKLDKVFSAAISNAVNAQRSTSSCRRMKHSGWNTCITKRGAAIIGIKGITKVSFRLTQTADFYGTRH